MLFRSVWNSIDEFDDISTKDQYHIARKAGLSNEEALEVCSKMSRDNARTPMQWSNKENAGFTTGMPWLKVNSNYKEINVKSQEKDADSVLNYYRKLVKVRKSPEYKEVFTYGQFEPAYEDTDSIMAYYRFDGEKRVLVVANFGKEAVELELQYPVKNIILSNRDRKKAERTLQLDGLEVIVLECS